MDESEEYAEFMEVPLAHRDANIVSLETTKYSMAILMPCDD